MRSIYLVPLALIACGDDERARPDATEQQPDDAAIDAATVACDYTEMLDATNDNFFGNGTAESSGLTLAQNAIGICGKFESTHYTTGMMVVDVDSYTINVTAESAVLMYLTAPGAESFNTVLIEIFSETLPIDEVGELKNGFAMASTTLAPGTYTINVSSFHEVAATADLDYKLVVAVDSPTRCAKQTGTENYLEANDGTLATGNDVYEVRYTGGNRRQLTALGTDAPEPTGITVAPAETYLVRGTHADPVADPPSWMDAYQERDTYAITTGATTNQLSIRLNWPGTTADLDYMVFPMDGIIEFVDAYDNALMEDEFATFSVDPSTTYWVWVGADDTTTLPVTYDLTVCGDTFTP